MSERAPLVVVGDALLDRDLTGTAGRLAPDRPVPVVEDCRERVRPGGAALAALLAAREGRRVTLVTALARDAGSRTLRALLAAHVTCVPLELDGELPVKTRLFAHDHQLARIDHGRARVRSAVPDAARAALDSARAVLVADYGRGCADVLRELLAAVARRTPLVWDPHPRGGPPVPGTRLCTPTAEEARASAAEPAADAVAAGDAAVAGAGGAAQRAHDRHGLRAAARNARTLAESWGAASVAVTLGANGALLTQGGSPLLVPAPEQHATDACGAGDSFAATAAGLLADGALPEEAVRGAVQAATAYVANGGAAALACAPPEDEAPEDAAPQDVARTARGTGRAPADAAGAAGAAGAIDGARAAGADRVGGSCGSADASPTSGSNTKVDHHSAPDPADHTPTDATGAAGADRIHDTSDPTDANHVRSPGGSADSPPTPGRAMDTGDHSAPDPADHTPTDATGPAGADRIHGTSDPGATHPTPRCGMDVEHPSAPDTADHTPADATGTADAGRTPGRGDAADAGSTIAERTGVERHPRPHPAEAAPADAIGAAHADHMTGTDHTAEARPISGQDTGVGQHPAPDPPEGCPADAADVARGDRPRHTADPAAIPATCACDADVEHAPSPDPGESATGHPPYDAAPHGPEAAQHVGRRNGPDPRGGAKARSASPSTPIRGDGVAYRDRPAGGGATTGGEVGAGGGAYEDAVRVVSATRARGGTVVATGGCFDVLHAGHVGLLEAARGTGDCLVVCVNSDASVQRRKGSGRPVNPLQDRVRVLRALEGVDAVAVFDEDTPERLLARLRPDVWVKGGDYALSELPEAALLEEWGGQAVLLPYLNGRSSSGIAARLRGGGP